MAKYGTNGIDDFVGTIFADEIFALGGDDTFHGSPGADTLHGGAGLDSVDYSSFGSQVSPLPGPFAGGAVDVDLQRAVQSGGLADGDVLILIENVGGSRDDDTIRGTGGVNILVGLGGDDLIEGRGGPRCASPKGPGSRISGAPRRPSGMSGARRPGALHRIRDTRVARMECRRNAANPFDRL